MKSKLAILIIAGLGSACAWSARTVGMQDPTVEVVRAMTASQAASIKALTDALVAASKTACPVQEGIR